jgi:hypothetical protein
MKSGFTAASGALASEEGYSRIAGEKQILTCRSAPRSPESVRDGVARAWAATGKFMESTARDIARSLGLHAEAYDAFVSPCVYFPLDKNTPTLLRMFRYDRPAVGAEKRVVAEPHNDLGMLSLVVGHTPGLDVLEPPSLENPQGRWISIEESDTPVAAAGGLTATLLSGQVLNFLTQVCEALCLSDHDLRPCVSGPVPFWGASRVRAPYGDHAVPVLSCVRPSSVPCPSAHRPT